MSILDELTDSNVDLEDIIAGLGAAAALVGAINELIKGFDKDETIPVTKEELQALAEANRTLAALIIKRVRDANAEPSGEGEGEVD